MLKWISPALRPLGPTASKVSLLVDGFLDVAFSSSIDRLRERVEITEFREIPPWLGGTSGLKRGRTFCICNRPDQNRTFRMRKFRDEKALSFGFFQSGFCSWMLPYHLPFLFLILNDWEEFANFRTFSPWRPASNMGKNHGTPPRGSLPDFKSLGKRFGHKYKCSALRVPNVIFLEVSRKPVHAETLPGSPAASLSGNWTWAKGLA